MIKLEHFYYVDTIAQSGSIKKAAEALYISQPYLSHSLKELETELRTQLFVRESRGVTLTQSGQDFLALSHQIKSLVDTAYTLGGTPSKEILSIASIYSFTMVDLFYQFTHHPSYQNHEFAYTEMLHNKIIETISSNQATLGLGFIMHHDISDLQEKLHALQLHFGELHHENLSIVVGKNHPLYNFHEVTLKDLSPYPLLMEKNKKSSNSEYSYNLFFPKALSQGLTKTIIFDNNRSLMHYLTKSKTYFSIGQKCLNLSSPFVQNDTLRYIPINHPDCKFVVGYFLQEETPMTTLLSAYLEHLKKFFTTYNQYGTWDLDE